MSLPLMTVRIHPMTVTLVMENEKSALRMATKDVIKIMNTITTTVMIMGTEIYVEGTAEDRQARTLTRKCLGIQQRKRRKILVGLWWNQIKHHNSVH